MAQPAGLDLRGVWDVRTIARHQPRVLERFTADAGVEAVASAWRAPLYGSPRRLGAVRSGRKEWASYNLVSPGYFAVFRIPLLRGRLFTQAEADSESPVVIVGEGVARRLWPDQDAVGQTIQIALPDVRPDPYWTRLPQFASARVIGVVRDLMSGMTADLGSQADFIDFYLQATAPCSSAYVIPPTPAGASKPGSMASRRTSLTF